MVPDANAVCCTVNGGAATPVLALVVVVAANVVPFVLVDCEEAGPGWPPSIARAGGGPSNAINAKKVIPSASRAAPMGDVPEFMRVNPIQQDVAIEIS
jgi:hypothetical protein